MANIQQAAKWLDEGKKVRINTWKKEQYIFKDGRRILAMPPKCGDAEFYAINTEDIFSDDWEIFQDSCSRAFEAWWKIKHRCYQERDAKSGFEAGFSAAQKHFTEANNFSRSGIS